MHGNVNYITIDGRQNSSIFDVQFFRAASNGTNSCHITEIVAW